MKDNFQDMVPNLQLRRQSCWVCYYPNSSPLFCVRGRRYVLQREYQLDRTSFHVVGRPKQVASVTLLSAVRGH
jgi:hypothetical protein